MYNERIIDRPFEETLQFVREAILVHGFMIVHEINTNTIMKRAGLDIPGLRQVFFFHPSHVKMILDHDPASVIRVPLKIAVREVNARQTAISFVSPKGLFQQAPSLAALADKLNASVNNIIQGVEKASI